MILIHLPQTFLSVVCHEYRVFALQLESEHAAQVDVIFNQKDGGRPFLILLIQLALFLFSPACCFFSGNGRREIRLYFILVEIFFLCRQFHHEGNAFLQILRPDMPVVHQYKLTTQREPDARTRCRRVIAAVFGHGEAFKNLFQFVFWNTGTIVFHPDEGFLAFALFQ